MRKTLLLAAAACALYAADPTVEGPRGGYVASSDGVRAVIGLVGSAKFSAPIRTQLERSIVLPDSDIAAGIDASGKLALVGLASGVTKTLDIAIDNVTSLHPSPGGAVLAVRTGVHVHVVSRDGTSLAGYPVPGSPLRIAVSDIGASLALTVAEGDGEALYLLGPSGSSRAFRTSRFLAVAFAAGSSDLLFADSDGAIYRLGSDLSVGRIAAVKRLTALAGDNGRALAIAGSKVYSIPFSGEGAAAVDCACEASLAEPLGGSKFLIVRSGNGPAWVLDASYPQLRLAFIPEPSSE